MNQVGEMNLVGWIAIVSKILKVGFLTVGLYLESKI